MMDFNYGDSNWLTKEIEKPIAEWTKLECIKWLQKKDGTYKECSISQMKRQINSKISMEERVSKEFSNYHKMIMPVLISFHYLVSLIMTSNKENIEKITIGIKIFLTLIHNLDKKMWEEKNEEGEFVPIWITKYNFINLLNVTQQIAMFGKVKNLWEGGALGEKMIQVPKRFFKTFQTNWESVLLSRIYQDYVVKNIQKEHKNERHKDNSTKYNSYKCLIEITYKLKEHKPINVIIDEDDRCLVNINNTYTLVIVFKHFVKKYATMNFFEIEIGDQCLFETRKEYVKGLLLPFKIEKEKTYTVVTEDWREISKEKQICLYEIEKEDIIDI